ncbi:MAG: tRNA (adenosine(37)-N6)-dimethylallyltransferase MiaA [Planctomycetota bacterium]
MPAEPLNIPVIAGPTAGGKTELAIAIAERLDGKAEAISADAYAIYRRLDIGTAKPSLAERAHLPHRLVDVVEPTDAFTVHDWLNAANAAVTDIRAHNRLPIVVGGTHLYIKAFLEGLFEGPGVDEALRADLFALDPAERRAELERVDPEAAARIHANDIRRTVRALEVYRLTGTTITAHQQQWDKDATRRTDATLVILDWPTDEINRRINARVKAMFERGLVDEVRALWQTDQLGTQAIEALGYKQLVAVFRAEQSGKLTQRKLDAALAEAQERIKIETRRFAKNQRTWLRRLAPGATVLRPAETPIGEMADAVLQAARNAQA